MLDASKQPEFSVPMVSNSCSTGAYVLYMALLGTLCYKLMRVVGKYWGPLFMELARYAVL